ncbi:farnesyl-diphosphate farnesyltransferase [Cystobasidium minutum MCA 4210]|uniref:farnesyl-diphosphate farnesyltransferase n=1 Tax=Cystobasidium minutum MCA 4210 TaxID=1397322 RepID=UPI0034CEA8D9|eukprot:jgi/Rhomi1/168330/fgenesh1_kg.2_\
MSKLIQYAVLGVTHPLELRSLINWAVWRDPKQRIEEMQESGYDRPNMKRCWELLDATSRSFAAVIKELEGDLCRAVCLFYLVLRGLDTVEDDMTLDLNLKCKLLEEFHEKLSQPGWTFTESGPNEEDRQLLVEFDKVISEVMSLDERYKSVITRICRHMGSGMAHYAREGAQSSSTSYAIDTNADFDLYCHYVAGLVGEGLSSLFSASGKEREDLGQMLSLSNSMGLMLQKTNIMRDFREDLDDGRFFWPREIWGKYTTDPKSFYTHTHLSPQEKAELEQKGLFALSEMILDALAHSIDCLNYLSLLKNQSVFQFCAIPQVMAIATLERCFMNKDVFYKNVKIRKSLAIYLIQQATNPREVARIFSHYGRSILSKAVPSDPNYLKLCIAVGQIEQWEENRYPSWIFTSPSSGVLRKNIPATRDDPNAVGIIEDARIRQLPTAAELYGLNGEKKIHHPRKEGDDKLSREDFQILMLFVAGMVLLIALILGIAFGAVWYFTTFQDTAIERNAKVWLAWVERVVDRIAEVCESAKNKFIKSEL